ncbi:helix-turn-helix transcriptional regulator [Leifsonia aquatica]|uniref:helix-turn-helix transcriptional regulator n=1 Tax=Leifsonia aquatica TaxID=144185 RepID=UPI0028A6CDE2|nr:helix-turn-helix transcriptional regulator [Leifsonia aquatica]
MPEVTPHQRMSRARLFAGIDQQQMAAILGRSRNTISAWERGVNEPPITAVAMWAAVTGRSIDWIMWGDEGMPREVAAAVVNAEAPAEAGAWVRHEGFEPPTF